MNKQFKRVLAVFLAVCMLIAVASGCGQTESGNSQQSVSSAPASEDANVDLTPGVYPIVKDPSKEEPFKVIVSSNVLRTTPMAEIPMVKELMEKTGVRFEFEEIPEDGITEKVNLMLAGGTLPDAFWSCIQDNMIVQYMNSQPFYPVEDLVDKYMPNLTSVYEKRPNYKATATAPDGHIYGFPYIEEMYGLVKTPGPFLINVDWLEKVGKEMPTTIDEWVDCLRAFKEAGDLNGNGKDDEYPYAFGFGAKDNFGSYDTFFSFTACFGQMISSRKDLYDNFLAITEDDEIFFAASDKAFLDTCNWFHGLYEEGLIDPDSFSPHSSPTQALYSDKLKASDVPIIGSFGVWAPANELPDPKLRAQYQPIPRMKGPAGEFGQVTNQSEMQYVARFAITSACDRPEILAKFIDYLYDPVVSVTLNWGMLGYATSMGDDGIIHYNIDEDNNIILQNNWKTFMEMRYNTSGEYCALAVLDDYYDTVADYSWDAVDLLEGQKINGKEEVISEHKTIPQMLMTNEEVNALAQIQPQIRNIVDSYRLQWIMDGNGDANWDQYLADLDAAGLPKYLEICQQAYDRYLKAQK